MLLNDRNANSTARYELKNELSFWDSEFYNLNDVDNTFVYVTLIIIFK